MHALNHIVEGTTVEKILWTTKLVGAIVVAVWLAWNFFVAFFKNEVKAFLQGVPKNDKI